MVLGLYKAGLELVLAHEGAEREAYVREVKNALVRYLDPMVGDRLGRSADAATRQAGLSLRNTP